MSEDAAEAPTTHEAEENEETAAAPEAAAAAEAEVAAAEGQKPAEPEPAGSKRESVAAAAAAAESAYPDANAEDGEAEEAADEEGETKSKKVSVVIVTASQQALTNEEQAHEGSEADEVPAPMPSPATKVEASTSYSGLAEGAEEEEYQEIEFADKRILVVGNCVMDYVLICEKYPTEDTDRRALDGYWQRGGNASNIATVLRQLHAPVEFFGTLSNSEAFSCLLEDCSNCGIIIDHCPRFDSHPPFSSVMLSQATGTRTIVHCNQNFPYVTYEHFRSLGDFGKYRWAHFEARHINETMQMVRYLQAYNEIHEHKIKISIDLEVVSKETLKLAPYADVNILGKDLARYMGWNDPVKACKGLRAYIARAEDEMGKSSAIVVPWSEQGAVCMDADDSISSMPAYPPPVIQDTLGAGDTFCAALIHAFCIQELFLREAVDFANRVAGFKCGHRGYDTISKMPLEGFRLE